MPMEINKECRRPPANILKKDNNYIIHIEMPGLHKDEIDISLSGNVLEISGEKEGVKYQKGLGGFIRKEFKGPIYSRQFELPKNADKTKIEAQMKNGILTLTFPVKEMQSERKKIPIK
jgi:HSP20 family protein